MNAMDQWTADTPCEQEQNSAQSTPLGTVKHKSKTRQSAAVYGLGTAITDQDSEITGARLPTCGQVLHCVMYHIQTGACRWEAAKLVLAKVGVFYGKAHIPMISERKACERMIKLLDENAKIRAIPVNRRHTPASMTKVKEMEKKLNTTFQLWPVNAERLLRNPEDLSFLQSMRSDRAASFGPLDKVLEARVQRRQLREQMEAKRQQKRQHEINAATSSVSKPCNADDNSSSSSSSSDSDGEFTADARSVTPSNPLRRHRRTTRTGTSAFIPHDIMKSPQLVQVATRLKMTPAQQATYTEAFIAEIAGDSSKVPTSYATVDRSRRQIVSQVAKECKENWMAPKLLTLHWDSKLMPSLSNSDVSEERLTVLVGDSNDVKLPGVPSYKTGADRRCGDIIAELTTNLLQSWNCMNSIVCMTFDTTAANTGSVTAACVSIQQKLGRPLLWCACRHHVGEVILTHVFDDLHVESSKSPDVMLFSRFRKNYDLLPHTTDVPLSKLDVSSLTDEAKQLVEVFRLEALKMAECKIPVQRDDYLEFAELCMVFLGGSQEKPVTFRKPGAMHKARWMAKLLYCIKICLLEQYIAQMPRGLITAHQQVPKIRDFANFVTLIYSRWWMSCSSSTDAPWHDLQLFHSLLKYDVVNHTVATSALKAFKHHLWYLTPEMVPLALFSSVVPAPELRALADALLRVKPSGDVLKPAARFGTGFGKPVFRDISEETTLADLVTADSWYTISILQLDMAFLSDDVDSWCGSVAYMTSSANVSAINVVNDCAERGVKLSADFLASAKSEEHYQNVLHVVEQNRKQQPKLRKRKTTTSEEH